jgi:hypothetical protein
MNLVGSKYSSRDHVYMYLLSENTYALSRLPSSRITHVMLDCGDRCKV